MGFEGWKRSVFKHLEKKTCDNSTFIEAESHNIRNFSLDEKLYSVILAIGRIVGETAALIYTAGTVAQIPKNAFGSGRTLAVHMYMLSSEGLYMNQAYATAVILLILVVVINTLSGMIAKRLTKK